MRQHPTFVIRSHPVQLLIPLISYPSAHILPASSHLYSPPFFVSPPLHLSRCDQDPHVIVAVARLFERDRKVPKARKWFDRAVALNPKLGDAWAHYYAFELRQTVAATIGQAGDTAGESSSSSSSSGADASSSSSAAEVVKRCVLAEPNRGELWCAVAKSTAYRRADVATVLKRVVERMYSAEAAEGQGLGQGSTMPMTE